MGYTPLPGRLKKYSRPSSASARAIKSASVRTVVWVVVTEAASLPAVLLIVAVGRHKSVKRRARRRTRGRVSRVCHALGRVLVHGGDRLCLPSRQPALSRAALARR